MLYKLNNYVNLQYVCFFFSVTDAMIKRIFKFWLWNKYVFNISQSGRDFNKCLKVLHNFTENVNKNILN